MVLTVEPRPHIKNQVDSQYCTQEVLPAINARLMCEKGVSWTSAPLINSSSSPAATSSQNRTLNIVHLDNYHAQLRPRWHRRWTDGWMDGIGLPVLMVTHTRTRPRTRRALIDSEKMDLDVHKLWDGSKNLQESDNPLLASPAPEIMDVHPLRFCSNRKCAVPKGAGRRRRLAAPFFLFCFLERQIIECIERVFYF